MGHKGLRYPPDAPTVEEIVAVMSAADSGPDGVRLRAIIVVLWRAGLRISEVLALNETDPHPARGSLVVRHHAARGIVRAGTGPTIAGVGPGPYIAAATTRNPPNAAIRRGRTRRSLGLVIV